MSAGNIIAFAAAAAAVLAVLVGWVQTNSTLRQNRELADLEAVRAVLDTAVTDLRTASRNIARIAELSPGSGAALEVACEGATKTDGELGAELERLQVRFGPDHPVVACFDGALQASANVTAAAEALTMGRPGPIFRDEEEIKKEIALKEDFEDRVRPLIKKEADRFEWQRTQFLAEAYTVGRAKLASRPDRASLRAR